MSKKIGKFNVVDIIIIAVVVVAVAFIGIRFLKPAANPAGKSTVPVTIELFVEETPDYAAKLIKEGDKIFDEVKNVSFGTVKTVVVEPSVFYAVNAQGEVVKTTKEDYSSVRITTQVDAVIGDYGVTIGVTNYGVGHTFTFNAGHAKLYGKVAGIEGDK